MSSSVSGSTPQRPRDFAGPRDPRKGAQTTPAAQTVSESGDREDHESTIVIDSSTNDSTLDLPASRSDFKPVKPGGKLLDFIELSESEEEEDSPNETDGSHYVTSVQSPMQMSFDQRHPTSTPVVQPRSAVPEEMLSRHPMKVVQEVFEGKGTKEIAPFEIEDEFCQSAESSATSTVLENSSVLEPGEEEDHDSAISSPSQEVSTSLREDSKRERETTTSGSEGDDEKVVLQPLEAPSLKKRRVVEHPDLPKTCIVLKTSSGKGILYLVGTAHFSQESVADVRNVIREVQPDCVVLELCPGRTDILRLDEKTLMEEAKDLSWSKIAGFIKRFGKVHGLMYVLMLSMSATLTKELGMAPGGEFRAAVKEASAIPGCMVSLGDRPIQITIQRALSSLSVWQKIKVATSIICSRDKITQEEVEKCKEKDILESMMEEMAGEFGDLTRVFVEERDMYLAYTLHNAAESMTATIPSQRQTVVVGVVGIGHMEGIKKYWENVDASDVRKVLVLPKPTAAGKAARLAMKACFYGLVLYGGYRLTRGPVTNIVARIMA